jgi:hypothetical protein
MKFYTQADLKSIAAIIAEAHGSTLEATLKAIGLSAVDLETQSGLNLKKADTDDAQAIDEYDAVVAAAEGKLNAGFRNTSALRQEAAQKKLEAANKKKVVALLNQ